MKITLKIKDNGNQILAIAEKNLKLSLRFKAPLVLRFFLPIFTILMPLIIMGQLFSFREEFGPWNETNYFVFQFVASQLYIIFNMRNAFAGSLRTEKFWFTLQALIIAPFNRVNLLLGYFLTYLLLSSPGLIIFFVACYIIYPISLLTVIAMLFIYLLSAFAFSGIGLILAIFAISKENIVPFLGFGLQLFFLFSTLNLPFEFFPSYIQNIIDLNPLYYIVNFTRLVWIEDNFFYSVSSHFISFMILIISSISLPIIGLKVFNYIFDRYGIVGY